MNAEAKWLLEPIRALHEKIWRAVVSAGECSSAEELSRITRDDNGDTIYAIDNVSEKIVLEFLEQQIAPHAAVVLIAEGLPDGKTVFPRGAREQDARWRIMIDPIDGTREWMYQKRSAWVLTGVAPNRGAGTSIADIELAVQTEIPLLKQHLSDALWAARGESASGERINRFSGERIPLRLRPSQASTIEQGFAMLARLVPGGRDVLADIDDEIVRGALGPIRTGKAQCFEDQYISTGGQFYELMCGHDRFNADLRPLLDPVMKQRGAALGICCHPYDVCTELIARELGVIVTNATGGPLNPPLDVEHDVAWIAYANPAIREQMEPLLQAALKKRGMWPEAV